MLGLKIRAFSKVLSSIIFAVCLMGTVAAAGQNPVYAADSSGNMASYTVRKGDTLYLIARYHDTTVVGLKAANSLVSDMIYPGQVLKIPGSLTAGSSICIVKSGDTLYKIALRYKTTVNALKSANHLGSDLIIPGQVLAIPGRSLGDLLAEKDIDRSSGKFEIFVDKTDHILTFYANGIPIKSYHVELGDGGTGDKEFAGDHKTPEGTFYVSEKSILSPADKYLGSRWMRLSYPNIEDAARGLRQGIIGQATYDAIAAANNSGKTPPQRTTLGGGVGIHGGSTPELGKDWTWGCVGLSNGDVEEIYAYVQTGTRVVIRY